MATPLSVFPVGQEGWREREREEGELQSVWHKWYNEVTVKWASPPLRMCVCVCFSYKKVMVCVEAEGQEVGSKTVSADSRV